MATQEDIKKRRIELKNFMFKNGHRKLRFDEIKEFYSNKLCLSKNLDDKTIRTDLKEIGAYCNKRLKNTYSLEEFDKICDLYECIQDLLSKCIICRPGASYVPLKEDRFLDLNNPKHRSYLSRYRAKNSKVYSIIIVSENEESDIINALYIKINELYSYSKDYCKINAFDIIKGNFYIEFKFIDIEYARNFYFHILDIESLGKNTQMPINDTYIEN